MLTPELDLRPGRTLAPVALEGNVLALEGNRLVRIADPKFREDQYSRVCLLESLDEGRTWSYVATIADQSDAPRHFNESALVETDNGWLLCVMRTDLDGPNPMYQAHSAGCGAPHPPAGRPKQMFSFMKGYQLLSRYYERKVAAGVAALIHMHTGLSRRIRSARERIQPV